MFRLFDAPSKKILSSSLQKKITPVLINKRNESDKVDVLVTGSAAVATAAAVIGAGCITAVTSAPSFALGFYTGRKYEQYQHEKPNEIKNGDEKENEEISDQFYHPAVGNPFR